MKRLHVNLAVGDLDAAIRFYSSLFDASPSVRKPDYAKWMLEDPRVNFAISTHGERKGVDHLGIQVEDEAELREVHGRLRSAGAPMVDQGETTCCYARSEKAWVFDPQGVAWETFLTHGESPVYGDDLDLAATQESACCAGSALDARQVSAPCCDATTKAETQARTNCCA